MRSSQMAGKAWREDDWEIPDLLTSSFWKAPVARNSIIRRTWTGSDNAQFLLLFLQRWGQFHAELQKNCPGQSKPADMPLIIIYQQVNVIYEHTLPLNSSNSAKTFIVLQIYAAIHVHVVV